MRANRLKSGRLERAKAWLSTPDNSESFEIICAKKLLVF